MQHGRMQIVDGCWVFFGGVSKFIGRSVNGASFNTSAGEEDGESFYVMIASVARVALAHGGATEFASPDNERFIEHAPHLEIFDEGSGGLVCEGRS